MRIGGAVVPGSIHETADGRRRSSSWRAARPCVVVHHGTQPTLFKDCAPVVADGHWNHDTFESDQILIKHGSTYQPPDERQGRLPAGSVRQSMRAQLGYGMLAIGTAAAVLGVATLVAGLALQRPAAARAGAALRAGRPARGGRCAFAVMESALFAHDYSIKYVAENVALATPGLYTFTAAWGALAGSILLWSLALSVYVGVHDLALSAHARPIPLSRGRRSCSSLVLVLLLRLDAVPGQPVQARRTGTIPLDGQGPNPLLQNHPLVAFHPPMLYAGYVGFTIPFSFAIAALVTGRFGEGWLADVRRTTLVAFGFLTVGIVLGAWWSYEVLGWGGYWGWDPVENASLLPWLTAVAFIHSVMVQERRGMLRVWNLSLVIATFCLTILGTFLTRSGVVNSVHAFSESSIGPWLLTFLGYLRGRRRRAHRVAGRQAANARAASTRRCHARRRSS